MYHCYPKEAKSQKDVALLKNYYDISGVDTRKHQSYCLSFAKSTIDYSKYKYNEWNPKRQTQESKDSKQWKQIQIEQSSTGIVEDNQDDDDEGKDKDKDNNTTESQESKGSKDAGSEDDESEFIGISGVR